MKIKLYCELVGNETQNAKTDNYFLNKHFNYNNKLY
jgi:hypothetical protein